MHTETQETKISLFMSEAGSQGKKVRIYFDGQPLDVPDDVSVASALLMSGVRTFRSTPVSGSARAPYCMMGVCFECLVEIDGRPSRQSCLTQVRDGMLIQRQEGASGLNMQSAEN
ncbi:2Fe-2S iron-sulfur cluster protein [Acidovorax delafieldii]|jgi:predicted molibdopterin-dependent oxidoreductase YjgC|uniref:2Fe-2S iron-sulfur cluster protein n=1 Tax=Acidovorax delafieldii TaxID=47920 RepID=A0A561XHV6_ACIDE|nr:2Fe-2S iron-sulfur cluster protein [Acidovorax delafieldii]